MRQIIFRLVGLWGLFSLILLGYWRVIYIESGTPNWIDALVVVAIILASQPLIGLAAVTLERWASTRRLLLVLPWVILLLLSIPLLDALALIAPAYELLSRNVPIVGEALQEGLGRIQQLPEVVNQTIMAAIGFDLIGDGGLQNRALHVWLRHTVPLILLVAAALTLLALCLRVNWRWLRASSERRLLAQIAFLAWLFVAIVFSVADLVNPEIRSWIVNLMLLLAAGLSYTWLAPVATAVASRHVLRWVAVFAGVNFACYVLMSVFTDTGQPLFIRTSLLLILLVVASRPLSIFVGLVFAFVFSAPTRLFRPLRLPRSIVIAIIIIVSFVLLLRLRDELYTPIAYATDQLRIALLLICILVVVRAGFSVLLNVPAVVWIRQSAAKSADTRIGRRLRHQLLPGLIVLACMIVAFGIYLSHHPAGSWNTEESAITTDGLPAADVVEMFRLFRHPADNALLGSTIHGTVFRFDQAKNVWHLAEDMPGRPVSTIVTGKDGQTLFAGTPSGIYFSSGIAGNWQHLEWEITGVQSMLLSPTKDSFLVGTPNGLWNVDPMRPHSATRVRDLIDQDVRQLSIGPNGMDIFASTSTGLFRLVGGSKNWAVVSAFADRSDVRIMAGKGIGLVAAAGDTIFRSNDGGETWERIAFVRNSEIGSIEYISNGNKQQWFIATDQGVQQSIDLGLTWQPVNQGLEEVNVSALAIEPDGNSMYLITDDADAYCLAKDEITWQPANSDFCLLGSPETDREIKTKKQTQSASILLPQEATFTVNDLASSSDGTALLASTSIGLLRSVDGGITWEIAFQDNQDEKAILVEPILGRMFVGTGAGLLVSEDNGQTFQEISSLRNADVSALTFEGVNRSIYAAVKNRGLLRSKDDGRTWDRLEALPSTDITALAVDPVSNELFAASKEGLFRFDSGRKWDFVAALPNPNVQGLVANLKSRRLFAGTMAGVFYSIDGGKSWIANSKGISAFSPELLTGPNEHLIVNSVSRGSFVSSDGGETWKVALTNDLVQKTTRSALTTLLLLRYGSEFQIAPQTIRIQSGDAYLYRFENARFLRQFTMTAPFIAYTPEWFQQVIVIAWMASLWVFDNRIPLAVGTSLALIMWPLYIVAGIARPNHLGIRTAAWLLIHPSIALSGSAYSRYRERQMESGIVEQLALQLAPTNTTFTQQSLEVEMRKVGALFDQERLTEALDLLTHRSLIVRQGAGWRIAEPELAKIDRRHLGHAELERLVEQSRNEDLRFSQAKRFFEGARFYVEPIGDFGLRCVSDAPRWHNVSPLYVRLVLERALDLQEYEALRQATQQLDHANGDELIAAVVIDRTPNWADLLQIVVTRSRNRLTIVPIPRSIMTQALIDNTAGDTLEKQLEQYRGRTDLYAEASSVSGILSFYGRGKILADLHAHLRHGKSAMLFGLRKIGKSSVLQQLLENSEWPVALINLDYFGELRQSSDLGNLYQAILTRWHSAIVLKYPHIQVPDVPPFGSMESPAAQLQSFGEAVNELLKVLGEEQERPGLHLFVDEVDDMPFWPQYYELAKKLRGIAEDTMHRGRFSILAAGLDPTPLIRRDKVSDFRNPFFSFFREVPLGFMSREDSRYMVTSIGASMGIEYTSEALDTLIEAGSGHPFLTRQLCSLAVRDQERPTRIATLQAEHAIREYLRRPRNYLDESLWRQQSVSEQELVKLLAVAEYIAERQLIPMEVSADERTARKNGLWTLKDQSLVSERMYRDDTEWLLNLQLYRWWLRLNILNLPYSVALKG